MKKSNIFLSLLLFLIAALILFPAGSILPRTQDLLGIRKASSNLGGIHINSPKNWAVFISSDLQNEKKFFGVLPIQFMPFHSFGDVLDDNFLVAFSAPHKNGYSFIYVNRMNVKDHEAEKQIEKVLIESQQNAIAITDSVIVSQCKFDQWRCYKTERLLNKGNVTIFFLPDISIQIAVTNGYASLVSKNISIRSDKAQVGSGLEN